MASCRRSPPRRDHLFELNFSITLFNNDELERAAEHFAKFEVLYAALDEEAKKADPEVAEQRQALLILLPQASG
jgi:Bardet-Biedl syndrome 4 protein